MSDVPGPARLPLVVLISGGGRTLANLIEKIGSGELPAQILLVISSDPQAGGLEIARRAGVAAAVVERRSFATAQEYGAAIFDRCRGLGHPWVVMGGFLQFVPIPSDFENRVLNIHPAVAPAFSGRGFYGRRVHEAVLGSGVKVSGCTVHFADNQLDRGPIILQREVPVLDDDTPERLAARVFEAECEAYPAALRLIAAGRVHVAGNRVRIE